MMWTIGEILDWTTARFERAGIASARADATHLLAHALGCSRITLYVRHEDIVPEEAKTVFRESVRRRLTHEPVAYIEGRRGFHALDLELRVDARVLVPRPETEHLVDWLLEDLCPPPSPVAVLDVGTGSGAIALAVKHARPDAEVTGSDVSEAALEVARANADAHTLDVRWVCSDLLDQLVEEPGVVPEQGFSAIGANLPYVARGDLAALPADVLFEPTVALDGGADGLDVVRALVQRVVSGGVLASQGRIYLEIGYDQAQATAAVLADAGFIDIDTRSDYADIPRIVRGVCSRGV